MLILHFILLRSSCLSPCLGEMKVTFLAPPHCVFLMLVTPLPEVWAILQMLPSGIS